jgi:hypothetical protein
MDRDRLVRIGERVINLAHVTNMRLEEDAMDVQFVNGAVIGFRGQEAKAFHEWIMTSGEVESVEESGGS